MKSYSAIERAKLDDDQWRAVETLGSELNTIARNVNEDRLLAQVCGYLLNAYVQALSTEGGPEAEAWRRFYDLAVFVVGRTRGVADAAGLVAFVDENWDLARDHAA